MATKKKVSTSKITTASKSGKVVKKTSPKKQKKVKAGSRYECGVCGLAVTIDKGADFCDITCCGEQMKKSK